MSDKNDVNDSVISFGVEREEGYLGNDGGGHVHINNVGVLGIQNQEGFYNQRPADTIEFRLPNGTIDKSGGEFIRHDGSETPRRFDDIERRWRR